MRHVRRIAAAELTPCPGFNFLLGGNGAGKTSLLEAIYLLGYGRSFRGRVRDGLIQSDAPALEAYAEWEQSGRDGTPRQHRIGLRHSGQAWEGRLDGATETQLGTLCAALAVVCFEPGSHELVSGGAESRRRFIDWGVFHVEHTFLALWRRYSRALKQRNRLLKQSHIAPAEFEGWEREMADAGEAITRLREQYLDQLTESIALVSAHFLPELGAVSLHFQPGWRRDELSLLDALLVSRDRDHAARFTTAGPHRADWRIHHANRPNHETLSRGQAKLTALACILAQARHYSDVLGEWPVVLLDDLASELDPAHQRAALAYIMSAGAQVFATGTHLPEAVIDSGREGMTFHVKQGRFSQATST